MILVYLSKINAFIIKKLSKIFSKHNSLKYKYDYQREFRMEKERNKQINQKNSIFENYIIENLKRIS